MRKAGRHAFGVAGKETKERMKVGTSMDRDEIPGDTTTPMLDDRSPILNRNAVTVVLAEVPL